jgi:probable rRNA maturation factor
MIDIDDPNYFEIRNASISINDDGWLNHGELKSWIEKVVRHEEFSLLLTNDTHIQQLNKDFRGQDNPTNVLSFPDDTGNYLGDIAIALETIVREAKEQEKDFYHHFIHMLIHGLLHLQGYDHETDIEAEEMEALEIKILADMGIENPYI